MRSHISSANLPAPKCKQTASGIRMRRGIGDWLARPYSELSGYPAFHAWQLSASPHIFASSHVKNIAKKQSGSL